MRVNEKTVELNYCAQVARVVSRGVLWFGLTQAQERRLGFDACTSFGGSLIFFQFKASNWSLRNGARRFQAGHDQLDALRNLTGAHRRSVFYAFPLIGNEIELAAKGGDFLRHTWLADVSDLGSVGEPTGRGGRPRKTRRHNVDVWPGRAVFHSEPTVVDAINAFEYFEGGLPGTDGFTPSADTEVHGDGGLTLEKLDALARALGRAAAGLVLLPAART